MNILNLNKALLAGLFAATIITITACGGSGGGSSSSSGGTVPALTKITTIAGGGDSTTSTDPAQATFGFLSNLVAKDESLLFNSARDGTDKLLTLNLAANTLSSAAYSGIGTGETLYRLLAASADKYYFLTYKTYSTKNAFALYEANSELVAKHKAGNINLASSSEFVNNLNGLSARFIDPSTQAVLYNDGTNDQLFFIDGGKIRNVTLSGNYPTVTANQSSIYNSWGLTLKGDKLIVTDLPNSVIFEHDIKTKDEEVIAGIEDPIEGFMAGYKNAEDPHQAKLRLPGFITTSPAGNIYFSVWGVKGTGQKIVRKLAVNNGVYGAVTTAFGAAPDSTADIADLNYISDLEFVGNTLYLLDSGDNSKGLIKKIEFKETP